MLQTQGLEAANKDIINTIRACPAQADYTDTFIGFLFKRPIILFGVWSRQQLLTLVTNLDDVPVEISETYYLSATTTTQTLAPHSISLELIQLQKLNIHSLYYIQPQNKQTLDLIYYNNPCYAQSLVYGGQSLDIVRETYWNKVDATLSEFWNNIPLNPKIDANYVHPALAIGSAYLSLYRPSLSTTQLGSNETYIDQIWSMLLSLYVQQQMPIYHVSKSLLYALTATKLPTHFSVNECRWPHESVLFLLPKDTLDSINSSNERSNTMWIWIGMFKPNRTYNWHSQYPTTLSLKVSEPHMVVIVGSAKDTEKLNIQIELAPQSMTLPEDWNNFCRKDDLQVPVLDHNTPKQSLSLVARLLQVMMVKPELVSGNHLGAGYKIKGIPGEPWTTGAFNNMAWEEPYLFNNQC